jgi:hypothetical protein
LQHARSDAQTDGQHRNKREQCSVSESGSADRAAIANETLTHQQPEMRDAPEAGLRKRFFGLDALLLEKIPH